MTLRPLRANPRQATMRAENTAASSAVAQASKVGDPGCGSLMERARQHHFYFPLVTCLVVSIVLSALFSLFNR